MFQGRQAFRCQNVVNILVKNVQSYEPIEIVAGKHTGEEEAKAGEKSSAFCILYIDKEL